MYLTRVGLRSALLSGAIKALENLSQGANYYPSRWIHEAFIGKRKLNKPTDMQSIQCFPSGVTTSTLREMAFPISKTLCSIET